MQGQVTLMFAIDDTGSMIEEIAAAKEIATSIVNEQRVEPVDYILSPFNDPGMHSHRHNSLRKWSQSINHGAMRYIK